MNKRIYLFLAIIIFSVSNITFSKSDNDWSLIWSDEFNGESLDNTKWDYWG